MKLKINIGSNFELKTADSEEVVKSVAYNYGGKQLANVRSLNDALKFDREKGKEFVEVVKLFDITETDAELNALLSSIMELLYRFHSSLYGVLSSLDIVRDNVLVIGGLNKDFELNNHSELIMFDSLGEKDLYKLTEKIDFTDNYTGYAIGFIHNVDTKAYNLFLRTPENKDFILQEFEEQGYDDLVGKRADDLLNAGIYEAAKVEGYNISIEEVISLKEEIFSKLADRKLISGQGVDF